MVPAAQPSGSSHELAMLPAEDPQSQLPQAPVDHLGVQAVAASDLATAGILPEVAADQAAAHADADGWDHLGSAEQLEELGPQPSGPGDAAPLAEHEAAQSQAQASPQPVALQGKPGTG